MGSSRPRRASLLRVVPGPMRSRATWSLTVGAAIVVQTEPTRRASDVTDGTAYLTPEARARVNIDRQLVEAGWVVQDVRSMNLYAGPGVAVREFSMKSGHGEADYLLFVPIDGRPVAVGVIEAKKEGSTLSGVEIQSRKYTDGLPDNLSTPIRPLPIAYESTGIETMFTCGLDPDPRSRQVFSFHRPETVTAWVRRAITQPGCGSLRGRLSLLPEVREDGLRSIQVRAIDAVESSIRENRPRALAQMATGSGKTFMAANEAYRLIKFSDSAARALSRRPREPRPPGAEGVPAVSDPR